MVLDHRSPSTFNAMLGRRAIITPQSNKQTTLSFGPSTKRRKLSPPEHTLKPLPSQTSPTPAPALQHHEDSDHDKRASSPPRQQPKRVIPDSDADEDEEDLEDLQTETQQTDLEQALPPIKTDKEAIEEYEAVERNKRMDSGEWVKGKSSIYVDAFNLALDTVLEEESHLFDAAEVKVFEDWRKFDYEFQYLCASCSRRLISTY